MKKLIYAIKIVSIVCLFLSCTQTKKKIITIYDCNKKINPINIESLFITKYYYINGYSSLDFLSLGDPSNFIRLNGDVKSIQETVSETSIKFDEEYEEKLFVNKYKFDVNNDLIQKDVENVGKNINVSQENFRTYFISCKYLYSPNGLLINKNLKSVAGMEKKSEPRTERWNYFYDTDSKLLKEIYKDSFQDSTVVKYEYFDNVLSEAFVYNAEGKKVFKLQFNYDNIKNVYTVWISDTKWEYLELNKNGGYPFSEIVFYFDDHCKLKKVPKVNLLGSVRIGFNKDYEKIDINQEGDMTSITSFKVKNLKNDDLIYHDDIDFSRREYWSSKSFEYQYDNKNNWFLKKEGNIVYRRVINYR